MKNLIILLAALLIGMTAYSQTQVSIDPAAQEVGLDVVFSTTVEISSVTNLGGFELNVDFDPSLLQANSVTIGAFLGSSGRMVFPLTNSIDNANGLLTFAATTLGASPAGPNGDGTLITIEWTSTSSLNAETITDLLLQNVQVTQPNGTIISHSTNDGEVTLIPCSDPPVAICKDITVYIDASGSASITAADVDNGSTAPCGLASMTVAPNTFACEDNGPNLVTLTVTDDFGNTSTCQSTVTVVDNYSPTLSINPIEQTVFTASTFTTTVEIADVTNLGAFELEIDFDPALLQANSVTLEDFLGSSGRTIFPINNSIDNTNGLIEYAIATLGPNPPGPDGDGVLLTIEWSSTETLDVETTTDIVLQNVQVAQPDGTVMCKSLENASITISPCYIHDFDCDCDVDILDVTMAAYAYGTEPGDPEYNPMFDLDNDGDIDIIDITMVTFDYGWTCEDGKKSAINFDGDNSKVELSFVESKISDNDYEMLVVVENIHQLGAYEIALAYDPQNIELKSIEKSNFLEELKRETVELQNSIDSQNGIIQYAMTSLGSSENGAMGSGMLLKIKYKVKKNTIQPFQLIDAQLARVDAKVIDFKLKEANSQIGAAKNGTYIMTTFPSPFKNEMTLQYRVGEAGAVSFKVFDTYGKLVRQTESRNMEQGDYEMIFAREGLKSGVYVYSMEYNGTVVSTKRVVVN